MKIKTQVILTLPSYEWNVTKKLKISFVT